MLYFHLLFCPFNGYAGLLQLYFYCQGLIELDSLLMLGIILITGYLGGELAKKFNLPSLTGYIITGLILGPSLLDVISSPLL